MNSAPSFGTSMYPVPATSSAPTGVDVPDEPIAITLGVDVEVYPEGIMDYDITVPLSLE